MMESCKSDIIMHQSFFCIELSVMNLLWKVNSVLKVTAVECRYNTV